jgi:hypothetical protein
MTEETFIRKSKLLGRCFEETQFQGLVQPIEFDDLIPLVRPTWQRPFFLKATCLEVFNFSLKETLSLKNI